MSNLARNYQEKRDYIRMQVDTPAELTLSTGEHFRLTCIDLSSSGVQLKGSDAIPTNVSATLQIDSGGGPIPPLHAEVTVCRVTESAPGEYRIGLSIDSFA